MLLVNEQGELENDSKLVPKGRHLTRNKFTKGEYPTNHVFAKMEQHLSLDQCSQKSSKTSLRSMASVVSESRFSIISSDQRIRTAAHMLSDHPSLSSPGPSMNLNHLSSPEADLELCQFCDDTESIEVPR